MRIWHAGSEGSPFSVNGVNYKVWQIARAQAVQGHEISLILASAPDEHGIAFAREAGLELVHAPVSRWHFDNGVLAPLFRSSPPDVVNMHSVFAPHHATLARQLRRLGIPYIITPSGGLARQILARDRIKKRIYYWLLQRELVRRAAGIVVTLPAEEIDVRAYVHDYSGVVRWIPNAVDAAALEQRTWNGKLVPPRLIYLGRFDVYHKGLDILREIAGRLQSASFHLYGKAERRHQTGLKHLQRTVTSNVFFHAPVYGDQKIAVLADASAYIQTSRWESFGNSIADAMYFGLPCIIAETLTFASLFRERDLGCVLPTDPSAAATRLASALSDDAQLRRWAEHARAFAREQFHPRSVASAYVQLYGDVVKHS